MRATAGVADPKTVGATAYTMMKRDRGKTHPRLSGLTCVKAIGVEHFEHLSSSGVPGIATPVSGGSVTELSVTDA